MAPEPEPSSVNCSCWKHKTLQNRQNDHSDAYRETRVRHRRQVRDKFSYLVSDSLFLTPGSTCTTCSIMTASWFCSDPDSGPEKYLNLHKRAFVGSATGKSLGVNLVSGVTALHPALPPSSPSGVAHKCRVFISNRIWQKIDSNTKFFVNAWTFFFTFTNACFVFCLFLKIIWTCFTAQLESFNHYTIILLLSGLRLGINTCMVWKEFSALAEACGLRRSWNCFTAFLN